MMLLPFVYYSRDAVSLVWWAGGLGLREGKIFLVSVYFLCFYLFLKKYELKYS